MTKATEKTANYSPAQEATLTAWAENSPNGKLTLDLIRSYMETDKDAETPMFDGYTTNRLMAKASNMGIYAAKTAKAKAAKGETKADIIVDICRLAGLNENQFDGKQNLIKLRDYLLAKAA